MTDVLDGMGTAWGHLLTLEGAGLFLGAVLIVVAVLLLAAAIAQVALLWAARVELPERPVRGATGLLVASRAMRRGRRR